MNCHMAISQQRQSLPLAQRGDRWWCWSQQDDTVAEALLATEHSTREQLLQPTGGNRRICGSSVIHLWLVHPFWILSWPPVFPFPP